MRLKKLKQLKSNGMRLAIRLLIQNYQDFPAML